MKEAWPHQFTKVDEPIQIGEEQYLDNTTRPVMAQPLQCVHCGVKYILNKDPRPADPCPARNTKREKMRLGV
jgi:hypothetical protein